MPCAVFKFENEKRDFATRDMNLSAIGQRKKGLIFAMFDVSESRSVVYNPLDQDIDFSASGALPR